MLLILVCLQICKYQIAHLHRLERTSFIANPALIMMSKSNSTLHKAQLIVKTNTAQRSVDYGTVYLYLVQCSAAKKSDILGCWPTLLAWRNHQCSPPDLSITLCQPYSSPIILSWFQNMIFITFIAHNLDCQQTWLTVNKV